MPLRHDTSMRRCRFRRCFRFDAACQMLFAYAAFRRLRRCCFHADAFRFDYAADTPLRHGICRFDADADAAMPFIASPPC